MTRPFLLFWMTGSVPCEPVTGGHEATNGVILDTWPVARLGMRRVLETAKLTCVLDTGDSQAALTALKASNAHLLVVGDQGNDAALAVSQAKALEHPPVVAVVAGRSTPDQLRLLLASGADGLLARSLEPYEVVSALRQLLAGERVVSPVLVPSLVGMAGNDAATKAAATPTVILTAKERQVLAKLAEGLSHDEIAQSMFVSFHTVKTHVSHIYAKLGVATRNGAVARGIALGLIS